MSLFLIKNERFEVKDGEIIHVYEACGDIDYAKEIQYIRVQAIIDRMEQ